MRSKRFEISDKRPINKDGFSEEWPEVGLISMNSPYDPEPSLTIKNGKIVEMDGKTIEEFDSIDQFIATYGIDIENAERSMAMDTLKIAEMLVDINVSRQEVMQITRSITPAKLTKTMNHLNVVEIMMGQMKMRARKTPANQAHVTNLSNNPILMAADAAEAALRGFSELETTTALSRFGKLNAIALLVGGLAIKPGVLTQCALEESMEIKIGLEGLTTYAETVSVYGTERVMDDGDDTPWSKALLASIYASRGIKMRFTSGTGSEVLMGHTERKSMLYLEARCLYLTRACGVQGTQNGAVSCIGIPGAVPAGFRTIACENLMASMLGLEVASGNDQTFTHSDMRRASKLFMQLLPGTDFITSGYSATPNLDDMFAGSNTDCEDYDDWYIMQRDMGVDGGITPVREQAVIMARNKAARAMQALCMALGFPTVTDREVEAATYAYSSNDMPKRDIVEDLKIVEQLNKRNVTGVDIAAILYKQGFEDLGENILEMQKLRISGDYLHTSAIINEKMQIISALNDANDYGGPDTGYRISPKRWDQLKKKETALTPKDF